MSIFFNTERAPYRDIFMEESYVYRVLELLLKDQTTGKNIVWATDTYKVYNSNTGVDSEMQKSDILDLINKDLLVPRVYKNTTTQKDRTKERAEVFTPSWVCNRMNNCCDNDWFGREGVFNIENDDNTWTSTTDKIDFGDKAWNKYVDSRRLEITCGEAPYLVSRYDTVSGAYIDVKDRIGILDRKIRVINENVDNEKDWLKWVYRAYESTYGYEYQGDNLFFARVNLLMTFADYYTDRFGIEPNDKYIKKVANIIFWNLWQMDGLKDTVPYVPYENTFISSLILGYVEDTSIYCKIKDWRSNKTFEFREMKESV